MQMNPAFASMPLVWRLGLLRKVYNYRSSDEVEPENLGVAHDLEAEEVYGLFGEDARFHLGDEYLIVDGVDAFEVGEEEAAPIAALDDDAVALAVEASGSSIASGGVSMSTL